MVSTCAAETSRNRTLTKPRARFSFWPPYKSVCFSACSRDFSLTYEQIVNFQKLPLFAALITAPQGLTLTNCLGHLYLHLILLRGLLSLWDCFLMPFPLKQLEWFGCDIQLLILEFTKKLSTQGRALAALTSPALYSFNRKGKFKLTFATTHAYLELFISSKSRGSNGFIGKVLKTKE